MPDLPRAFRATTGVPEKVKGTVFDRVWVLTFDQGKVNFVDWPQRLLAGDAEKQAAASLERRAWMCLFSHELQSAREATQPAPKSGITIAPGTRNLEQCSGSETFADHRLLLTPVDQPGAPNANS